MNNYEEEYYRVYAKVDLDAIRSNMMEMRRRIGPEGMICAVMKTDGYGHGAIPVAKSLVEMTDFYAVATVEEAMSLRKHGIEKPILILSYVHPSNYEKLIENSIRPTIFKLEDAEKLSEAAVKLGKRAKFHFKIDTGMSRIGFQVGRASVETMAKIAKLPGLEAEGVYTHFAKMDEVPKNHAERQHDQFFYTVGQLEEAGVTVPIIHCDNSAGIIDMPSWHYDMVRAGIAIYGLYPSEQVSHVSCDLKPALSLKSHVVFVKEIYPGTTVSYGGTYRADRQTRVATIPVGYGDGYPRLLSNKGWVLIRGHRVPILGRICMDQMMVDVTDFPDIVDGDVVTLIGRDGEEEITADEIAKMADTIGYEIICNLTGRVPRLYWQDGLYVGRSSSF